MAGAATSTTSLSTLMKTYYDRMLLERLQPNFRYDQFAVKKSLPKHEGKTILWNRLTNLGSGYPLLELTVPGLSAMSASSVSATITQLGNLIGISDLFNATSISQPVSDAVELLADGAALAIDNTYKEEIGFGSAASTGVAAGAASATYLSARTQGFPLLSNSVVSWTAVPLANNSFSTAISVDRIRNAVTHLRTLNVRPEVDGYFTGIIHPVIADKLMQDTLWASWNQYTNPQAMYKGEIGKVQGVRFVDSSNAMTSTVLASSWSAGSSNFSAGGTLYGTLIFGKGAYAGVKMEAGNGINTYIVPNDKADKADPLAQYGTVGYKIQIAAKVLNPSCGIIVGDYISS